MGRLVSPNTPITAKQEAFAQAVADGMSHVDAYRSAFKPPATSQKTAYQTAATLANTPKIATRISQLRAQLAEKCIWTREKSVKALVSIQERAPAAVKVSAVKELNAMHGFNAPMKMEINGQMHLLDPASIRNLSPDEINLLRSLLKKASTGE